LSVRVSKWSAARRPGSQPQTAREGHTFVVVQPDKDDPVWFASVAVLDEGGYEIVRRDTSRNEHEITTATSINDIARDLTIWLAARDFPGRPTRQVTDL
jgi:hypothetical protein